jgi:hypothetical protein
MARFPVIPRTSWRVIIAQASKDFLEKPEPDACPRSVHLFCGDWLQNLGQPE